MTVYRCILPNWAKDEFPSLPKVREGQFSQEQLEQLNANYYNIYYLPNYPSLYDGGTVEGPHIDTFKYVFVDMDLKEGKHKDKDSFLETLFTSDLPPTRIVDSGNGIHAYWSVSDLDAMSFLKLQRRLMRKFVTDESIATIYQLMRVAGTVNTKNKDDLKICELLYEDESTYSCEQLDKLLPPLSREDLQYCEQHYNKTYNPEVRNIKVDEKIPLKFAQLLRNNAEVKGIWSGDVQDRSTADYRLGHLMFANDFTKEEALSVLVNSAKALERAPTHRVSYATNIVDKIWTYEICEDKGALNLSSTVREVLNKYGDETKGKRFPCHRYIDATEHGFRLGQVIGLVAGVGVGKTAVALNMFEGFVEANPDYDHFFIPLEQPANEIAERWRNMCGDKEHLFDKVHIISNYDDKGGFRHLSFSEIKDYLLKFQEITKRKVGCVVIDHIGALKMKGKEGENQGLMDLCHEMKAFAIETNTLLVMQSQTSREKAGIGDLELNKDAAYGTVLFEAYCDYLITIWQPLKRCYSDKQCPAVTAFKFCKIRHKKHGIDEIQEDVPYKLIFDPLTERLKELTQIEERSFDFFNKKATNLRKLDRKTDLVSYSSITWTTGGDSKSGKTDSDKDSERAS